MDRTELVSWLKQRVDTRVRLTFSDGESVTAALGLVLEDENAVVFDLIASNKPDKYEKSDKPPHIFANIEEIVAWEPLAGGPLEVLRSRPKGRFRIHFSDGEIVLAEDFTILEDDGLVWYHLLRSNRPEKYESFDEPYLSSAKLLDILRCDPVDAQAQTST